MGARAVWTAGIAFAAITLAASSGVAQSSQAAPAKPPAVKRALSALSEAADRRESKRVSERYDPIFRKYTKRYFGVGTDWHWFKAQGMAESDLTPTARSRVGARGIMQLMPSTYGMIKSALPRFGAIDDPEWNIAAGILHDRDLWTVWGATCRSRSVGPSCSRATTPGRARSFAREKRPSQRVWITRSGRRSSAWRRASSDGGTPRRSATYGRSTRTRARWRR